MQEASESQGVRSLIDQAGRLFDSAAEQLKTPRKENKTSSSRIVSTPASAKKQESSEFPVSHSVKAKKMGKRIDLDDDESPRVAPRGANTKGLVGGVMLICVYGAICAGTGCMLVAHGDMLDQAMPTGVHDVLHAKLSDVAGLYDRTVPEQYKKAVTPVPGFVYEEVCVKRVNPVMQWARHVVLTAHRHLSLDSLTENAKQGIHNGIVVYKKNARDIQEYIQKQFGRMDPFWMQKKHESSALIQAIGNEVPSFVLEGIIQPLIVLISVSIGVFIALWVVMEVFVSSKKT